jgi:polyisoprenoid-binding protein YceI
VTEAEISAIPCRIGRDLIDVAMKQAEKPVVKPLLVGALVALAVTLPQILHAEVQQPNFVIPLGSKDASKAIAGNYTLDPNHVGVVARVSHLNFSISIFRFEKAKAVLTWNPRDVARSRLDATVDTASITSNVPGFAQELSGVAYLDTAKYPEATFVSTAFHQTDKTHGTVLGTFTLRGKSKPMTFVVTLIGAGPGFAGSMEMGHVIGIHAEGTINPQDYGLPAMFKEPIGLVIDTEFDRTKANNP